MAFYLVKGKDGKYSPSDDEDYEHSKVIPVGGYVKCTTPRHYEFHKKAFCLLKIGFENQEKYPNPEVYRKVMTIKAGYFDLVEGNNGPQYLPKSLSYENMSAQTFKEWYDATIPLIAKQLNVTVDELENEI